MERLQIWHLSNEDSKRATSGWLSARTDQRARDRHRAAHPDQAQQGREVDGVYQIAMMIFPMMDGILTTLNIRQEAR
jgi:hypothetical protein